MWEGRRDHRGASTISWARPLQAAPVQLLPAPPVHSAAYSPCSPSVGFISRAEDAGGWAPFNDPKQGNALLGALDLSFLAAYASAQGGAGKQVGKGGYEVGQG